MSHKNFFLEIMDTKTIHFFNLNSLFVRFNKKMKKKTLL